MNGWIKLHRQITEWEWYSDSNTFRLFIHLLLKANHKDNNYRGKLIKQGCLVTGREKLSLETGLSIRQVRTCLERLEMTNEIAIKSSSKGTEIQIVKYVDYQVTTNETTDKVPSKRPTNDQQTTTNKNEKNDKEEKEEDNSFSFDRFWNIYDKKVDKTKCEVKFNKLSFDEKEKIKVILPKYIKSTPEVKYRKNPLTWLNGKCWNDEVEDVKSSVNQIDCTKFNPYNIGV